MVLVLGGVPAQSVTVGVESVEVVAVARGSQKIEPASALAAKPELVGVEVQLQWSCISSLR